MCDTAKRSLQNARSDRTGWFGTKTRAKQGYETAARQFRDAGDHAKAEHVEQESNASDIKPYIEAEKDAEGRQANLKEASNLKDIARKIEVGAYESGSCGDLLKAAEYYFQSARFAMKADRFEATNALLLRHDQLERIVDEAKKKGLCDRKSAFDIARRGGPPGPTDPPPDDSQCRALAVYLDRKDIRDTGEGATMRIENAPRCKKYVQVNQNDCLRAAIYWIDVIPSAEKESKLKMAGCERG